jgi:hypothetical protein
MTAPFCASCLADHGTAGLHWADHDGKRVILCVACDEGSLRGGRWGFDGGRSEQPAGNNMEAVKKEWAKGRDR